MRVVPTAVLALLVLTGSGPSDTPKENAARPLGFTVKDSGADDLPFLRRILVREKEDPAPKKDRPPDKNLKDDARGNPIGRWSVEFANDVTQACEIRRDGTASVVELALPKYFGKGALKDGPVLIEYGGDRTQRFTSVGKRMIVEHWYPGAKKDAARPILGIAERATKDAKPGLRYTDATRGFRLTVPDGWSAVPASFPVMHYRDVFLCVNSRGNKALRVTDKRDGDTVRYSAEAIAQQLEPGTAYIDVAYFEGPGITRLSGVPDSVGSDLASILKGVTPTKTAGGKLSTMETSFVKRERRWSIHVYFREPVKEDVREKAWKVLRSFELTVPREPLPVGLWNVEFANGGPSLVRDIRKDGTFSVRAPLTSKGKPAPRIGGKATVKDSSVVLIFDEGRIERWTPVDKLFVVEYWPADSKFPAVPPLSLGIAERAKQQ